MAATKEDGCFTVGVLMARDYVTGDYVTEHVVRGQWAPGERDRIMKQTAMADGNGVVVGWEEEPGSAGKSVTAYMSRLMAGFRLWVHKPTGPKPVRWGPHASQAERGNVKVVAGRWTAEYLDELCSVTSEEIEPIDQCDATGGAFIYLALQMMPRLKFSEPAKEPDVPSFADGMTPNSPW